MKNWRGVWLPDDEQHLIEWMGTKNQLLDGKPTYQRDKVLAALSHVKTFRRAVDVGAHCGLWSYQLAKHFNMIEAFEPVPAHIECFYGNMDQIGAWRLHPIALGEKDGFVRLETGPASSGDTKIAGDGDIPMKRLDDVLPDVADVDFMKLDTEGYELFILRGAVELIKRCKPVIIVEQKPGRAAHFDLPDTGAVTFLESLGYTLRRKISGDFILTA